MKKMKEDASSILPGTTEGDVNSRLVNAVEEKALEAFFAGRISADGRQKVMAWLSREFEMPVTALEIAVEDLGKVKSDQKPDPTKAARFRLKLLSEIKQRQLSKTKNMGEESEKSLKTKVPRPSRLLPLSPVRPSLSQSNERKTPRLGRICVMIRVPQRHARSLRAYCKKNHVEVHEFVSVAAAIQTLNEIPPETSVFVRHGPLTATENAALQSALKAPRTAVQRPRSPESDDVSVEGTGPNQTPPSSPISPRRPKRPL